MTWDCTELSKILKEKYEAKKIAGGLIDSDKMKMIPWIAGAFVGGVVVTLSVQKAIKHFSQNEEVVDEELEDDKKELIEDIKEDNIVKEIIEEVPIDESDTTEVKSQ